MRRFIRWLEKTCWAVGGLLLIFYAAAHLHAVLGREQALDSFRVARATAVAAAEATTLEEVPAPEQSLWAPGRIAAYVESLKISLGTPAGVLRIPKLDLSVPIFEGTSELVLNRGVGWIRGTASLNADGNIGIAGHRDGYFRVLKDIAAGDVIEIETLTGLRRFRVADVVIVDPHSVGVLAPRDTATLTLVTCYPFYYVGDAPQRFIVRAQLDAATGT